MAVSDSIALVGRYSYLRSFVEATITTLRDPDYKIVNTPEFIAQRLENALKLAEAEESR